MTGETPTKSDKINHPSENFNKPTDVVKDKTLSDSEKKRALNTWEQDARQLMTASNEGMTGSQEGHRKDEHNPMGEVVSAKEKIGEKPKHKPAQ